MGRTALANFEGYYNNPEADAERTRNGWYWSGDLAYRDEEGIFYFAGRTGDWLRVDSENFAAAPVERILARYPGVAGVAVIAVPDVRTGDQVMAALELEPGRAFDPEAFSAFLAAQEDLGTKLSLIHIYPGARGLPDARRAGPVMRSSVGACMAVRVWRRGGWTTCTVR